MSTITATIYKDIDWLQLWKNERELKSWRSKGAKDWDKKALTFSERTLHSPYVPLFLSRLPLNTSMSVLDIGCGPGTLALPLAEHVFHVSAMDYSPKMLEILDFQAKKKKLDNIKTILCSWEDDWQKLNIHPADIVIASRSMNVDNLPQAIDKLQYFAKNYVFITDRISPSPFDPDAFKAIGREFSSGPDYIFTLNMLYSKNIHPNVEILSLENDPVFDTMEEAYASYSWMFKNLDHSEEKRLQEYVTSISTTTHDAKIQLFRNHPPRWAMIWWKKSFPSSL